MITKFLIASGALAVTALSTTLPMHGADDTTPQNPVRPQNPIRQHQQQIDRAHDGMLRTPTQRLDSQGSVSTLPSLTVLVDQTYCGSSGIQCTGSGVPANGNFSPVRLGVMLQSFGGVISGLSDSDFTISNPFVPAGGASVGKTSCGACFQEANGLYTLFVAPSANPWKSGGYLVRVDVSLPNGDGLSTVVLIEIP